MMSGDRREDPGAGLLLYLRDASMKTIPADHANKRGILLVFRVYYERPMAIHSLNLKLRQIVRFWSKVILDEMSSAMFRLLFGFF